jgi:hypothetical protein
MTEEEWLSATNPPPMLGFLRGKVSDRKLRLFACACCRRIWDLYLHHDSFRSIEVGEKFADGEATNKDLRTADELAMWAGDDASWTSMQEATIAWTAAAAVQKTGILAANWAVYEMQSVFAGNEPKCEEEQIAQCHLLREIFGNPFRPVALNPSWLSSTILALANGIYAERAFDRMPILADALQDAGCENLAILDHCRSTGPHVRGCWVVDLVLARI